MELKKCCGLTPIENLCSCRGKSEYEVACKICRRRTGPLMSRLMARQSWNDGECPSIFAVKWGYEIQSQEWGYEFVKYERGNKVKKIYHMLNVGGGKTKPMLDDFIDENDSYFLVNVDKSYFNGLTPEDIEVSYFDFEQNQLVYDCKYDIFEFLERTRIKFDTIFIHRFFEHLSRDKILYFIYLLSTITEEDSIIDLISPNYQQLAYMILNEDPKSDPDFDKKDIIISTELFNESNDPHQTITTPARIKRWFEYEGRFKVTGCSNPYDFDGRNIYFKSVIRRR